MRVDPVLVGAGQDVEPVENVERGAVTLLERLLERRLEAAADVDDERCVADSLDVARGELEVVGLRRAASGSTPAGRACNLGGGEAEGWTRRR